MDFSKILADACVPSGLAERVLRGNALLDEKLPEDWFQHVDDVIISDILYCVLGQLGEHYDGRLNGFQVHCVADYRQPYSAMLLWMDTPYENPGKFGFDASNEAYDDESEIEEMNALSRAWNILLAARRNNSQ